MFVQNGLATKVEKSRKQLKERKNRAKKIRGVKKVNISCSVWRIFASHADTPKSPLTFFF